MTGKGDRWGRDRLGRSAPAFLSANTFALPPLTCTARGRPPTSAAVVIAARPAICGPFVSLRPVPGGEYAGCVCLQCLVQQAVCLSTLCHVMPTALNVLAPVQCCFAPCSFHVRQDQHCTNSLQAARLSRWQLQHGPAVAARAPVHLLTLSYLFPAESMILGHGLV